MTTELITIIGLTCLLVGLVLATGKIEKVVQKIRKKEMRQQGKAREMCLRAGELAMLDGLILLMKGLFVNFENHFFTYALLAWAIIACFDILYVTVTNKNKMSKYTEEDE